MSEANKFSPYISDKVNQKLITNDNNDVCCQKTFGHLPHLLFEEGFDVLVFLLLDLVAFILRCVRISLKHQCDIEWILVVKYFTDSIANG